MKQTFIILLSIVLTLSITACVSAPTATPFIPAPIATTRTQSPIAAATVILATRTPNPVATVATDSSSPRALFTLTSFTYGPTTIQARAGQPIRLDMENISNIDHQFAIDDSDLNVVLLPGFKQKLDFVITKPGTYIFACNLETEGGNHRAAGMIGKIVVEP